MDLTPLLSIPIPDTDPGNLVPQLRAEALAIDTALGGMYINATAPAYGADPTGTVDSTTALQAAIDAGIALGIPTIIPPGDYLFSGLTITDAENVVVEGIGTSGEISKVRLLYTGSTVGITLDRVRNSRFGNFQLLSDDGTRKMTVGLDIDQKVGTGSGISTANHFHDIQIYNATKGVRIANTSTANNELHVFERVYPRLDPVTAGTIGWSILDAQSKFHTFRNCAAGFCDIGIKTTAGSFIADIFNFTNNNVDYRLEGISEPVTFLNPQSETAGRFIETSSPGSATIVTVVGGRLSTDARNADGNYIYFHKSGTLSFHGTNINDGTRDTGCKFDLSGASSVLTAKLILTGVGLPSDTSLTLSSSARASIIECTYLDGSGNNPYLSGELNGNFTGPMIPPTSDGTATFGIDSSGGTALSIANNATATPFSNANNFSGILMVNDPQQTGETGMFIVGGSSTVALLGQSGTLYSVASGTAGKVNVYASAGVVTIQNKQGNTIAFKVFAIRIRNSG